jgi:hypothetical protein
MQSARWVATRQRNLLHPSSGQKINPHDKKGIKHREVNRETMAASKPMVPSHPV